MRVLSIAVAVILALRIVGAGDDAFAQPAAATARIGYLSSNIASNRDLREAFRQGLRDLGYVEGKSVVIEYRDAQGKAERLPALAAELVALKVDVIVVAAGTQTALAVKQATRSLPIVFIGVGNPVTSGLAASLSRPGGNATGTSSMSPELAGKWPELLKQAIPGMERLAILWKPGSVGETEKEVLEQSEVAAKALGMRLQRFEAHGPADIDRAFTDMAKARVGALEVLSTNLFANERRRLVDLAARHRIPTMFGFRLYVDAGGFMSYGPNLADLYRRAATYVDKILKGAKPGDLPVEQPTKFELVINLKAAREIGLTIPPSLLARADELIQ